MESRKNPNLVTPEYPIITNEKKKKKIKLNYALMRHRTLFSAVEVNSIQWKPPFKKGNLMRCESGKA